MCSLKINSIVKITEILTEDFWDLQAQQDRQMNPEAAAYAAEQADRTTDRTEVTVRISDPAPKYTNRARRGRTASAGWRGQLNTQARAGHITDQHRDRLLRQTGSEPNPPTQH